MSNLFLVSSGQHYSYEKLTDDLNNQRFYSNYIYVPNNDPYKIFLQIIHSILFGYSVEMLDGDFSPFELNEIGIVEQQLTANHALSETQHFRDIEQILQIMGERNEWHLTLYTSGTTGRPKKVQHSLHRLTRNVKVGDAFKDNVWAFAYNPTHIAGLQVFFQALFNRNTMIYTFAGQQKHLPQLIEKYWITNISATPTFYRSVIHAFHDKPCHSIKVITFGGEKYDPSIEPKLRLLFPEAKLKNIYASTEAGSLFVARGDVFEVPQDLRHMVTFSANHELLLHRDLLGNSPSLEFVEEWYHTGDVVELLGDYQFKFLSRKTEMINVGGYKVNPNEVENVLMQVPGVIDLIVKSKKNSVTGHILIADVVKDCSYGDMELKQAIKKYASDSLQEWKIPRVICFVEEIPRTRTGKKMRT